MVDNRQAGAIHLEASEMGQQVKVFAIKPKELSLNLETNTMEG